MAAIEIWTPREFKKRAKDDPIQVAKQKPLVAYQCGDPRCVRDGCQEGFGFDLHIFLSENSDPLQWTFDAKRLEGASGRYGFRLMDDEHLTHLLDIPSKKYQIYCPHPVDEWVKADVEKVMSFTALCTIIYREQNVEVSECNDLIALMKVVNEAEVYSDSGDLVADSDGWSTFSYPEPVEDDIDLVTAGVDETVSEDGDDKEEINLSSQGSL